MYIQRLTGSGAGVEKYDIITALAVHGLTHGGTCQTSMMRLIALLSSRYNWSNDEVTIGQKEMASLWGVDERTAKRETRRLIEIGFLSIKRPGIRGRVAAYHFNRQCLYEQTTTLWAQVGPDFQDRMAKRLSTEANAEPVTAVSSAALATTRALPSHPWEKTLLRLELDQRSIYLGWYQNLRANMPNEQDILLIKAPTKFVANYVSTRLMHQLEQTVRLYYGPHVRCIIESA